MKLESFVFDAAPPYPAGVDVADLLDGIEAVIKKHVVLSEEAAAALGQGCGVEKKYLRGLMI